MYICARGENFDFAKEIGVGIVDSGIELTSLVIKEIPQELIFIGSAGSYDRNIALFDIFISSVGTQIEHSFVCEKSYTPISNKIEIVSYETISSKINKYTQNKTTKRAIINSSNYINIDENHSTKMKNIGISLENMEFFSVLKVAEYFKIPAIGIFCVTNYCNQKAHDDFIKNHIQAKEKLVDYIKSVDEKYI